jgi:predicted amidohydrolase
MATVRIALANLEYPSSPDDSVSRSVDAIRRAGAEGADILCFPECYVPGYRAANRNVTPPDAAFLERAWARIAKAAGEANVAVVLGTERVTDRGLLIAALVINRDGTIAGFQDKTQVDPSEDGIYVIAESDRKVFESNGVKFGVAICHEGWRYPETVRWPVKHGAQIVFHPHFHWADGDSFRPTSFADPRNTFHEKAALCRAAENTCFFATINYATDGAPTTSAVVRPDGTLLAHQPYGQSGLLIVDLELDEATRLLASRCKDY